jgi:hypothetical protein
MPYTVKSKPVYSPLAADTGGRYHVLLGVEEGAAALMRVLEDLRHAASDSWQRTQVLLTGAAPDTQNRFRQSGFKPIEQFADKDALLTRTRTVLDGAVMGTRLYIAGPESFIGSALQIALSFNLNRDEIHAEHFGSAARRVRCVHCRADTEDVKTNIVRCSGCARWLAVRDHYSRRLAAYMGVMADAEVPGELPSICITSP